MGIQLCQTAPQLIKAVMIGDLGICIFNDTTRALCALAIECPLVGPQCVRVLLQPTPTHSALQCCQTATVEPQDIALVCLYPGWAP